MNPFDSFKERILFLNKKIKYTREILLEQFLQMEEEEEYTKEVEEYKLEYAYISHIGKFRAGNEDNYAIGGNCLPQDHQSMKEVISRKELVSEVKAMAVFDGIGGAAHGEAASYAAAKSFLKWTYYGLTKEKEIDYLVQRMNQDVCQADPDKDGNAMGTTMTSIFFNQDRVFFSNIGDSPSYLYRSGELVPVYCPHTNADFLKAMGLEHKKPKLSQYLGMNEENILLEPHISSLKMKDNDIYLLCSDGLTDMVKEEDIKKTLSGCQNLKKTVEELLSYALDHGGKDNITILLCRVYK